MPLTYKFFVLLVLAALLPLSLAGIFTFREGQREIVSRTIDRLEVVANQGERQVHEALTRYLEELHRVTGVRELGMSVAEYGKTRDEAVRARIMQSVENMRNTLEGITSVSIVDRDGVVLASTRPQEVGEHHGDRSSFIRGKDGQELSEVFKDEQSALAVRVTGPLTLEGQVVGVVEITAGAAPLLAVTGDYTGLGDTGEITLAGRTEGGDALYLAPLRFDQSAALSRTILGKQSESPFLIALAGHEESLTGERVVDYRGQKVFAVTRFIEPARWGLTAKIDRTEALAPITSLPQIFVQIFLLAVVLVIVIALFVARKVSRPILELAAVAGAIETGDLSKRASVAGHDEIGTLARALNDMAKKLHASYTNLEQKVLERTRHLAQAKAKDDAVIASIGDGLVVTDRNGNILIVNKVFEELLGWKKSEVLGKDIAAIIPLENEGGERVLFREWLLRVLAGEKITTDVQHPYYFVRRDNTRFPVSLVITPIMHGLVFAGVAGTFRDVSKEKEIDQAKTEFVSLASHQLRTPLSTINWYAEMLLAGDAGALIAEQKKYLEEIYRGNQRMVALVNALLNVSRLDLGTFVVDPEPVDVEALARSVLNEQKPQIDEKKLNTIFTCVHDIPIMEADPKLLRIILQNLLSNAVRYTDQEGTIKFDISLAIHPEQLTSNHTHSTGQKPEGKGQRPSILIRISDTGWGIPRDQQDKIFTKLFRADNVKEKNTDGPGLGLYLVKSIVEHAEGNIWFESEENKGTTFSVALPLEGMWKKGGTKSLS